MLLSAGRGITLDTEELKKGTKSDVESNYVSVVLAVRDYNKTLLTKGEFINEFVAFLGKKE